MSFLKLHKLCSYLLSLAGFLPLLLSGELHPLTWLVALVGYLLSWHYESPTIDEKKYRLRWTQGTVVGVLFAAFLGFSGIFPNPILLGAYLLFLLQLNKLFNRRESKDYAHLYILSFLMLTLGTIVNTGFSFAVCFLFYVVFLTWTLTLFHLRREIEKTYMAEDSDALGESEKVDVTELLSSRRLIQRSFLFYTSLISLFIFALTSTIFFMFPRIGFGLFFQRKRSGVTKSGFSNKVQFGNLQNIKRNRKVVLRVEFPNQKKLPKQLRSYWRGIGYDYYDGWSWKRSRHFRMNAQFVSPQTYILANIPKGAEYKVIKQVIYQEPLDVSILFGIDRVFTIDFRSSFADLARQRIPNIRRDLMSDTITLQRYGGQGTSLHYTVLSVPNRSYSFFAKQPHVKRRVLRHFLQLYKGFNPKIRALAQRVTNQARSAEAKTKALVSFLRKNYGYSLSRKSFKGFPLDDFLFQQKQGHCEFFSTALIMMLRSIGIPAREVTGFMGGSWNHYGKFYAVRQSDAHSWTEVFLPRRGWVRFDATPSAEGSTKKSFFRGVEALLDSLRLRWHKLIIEYDLVDQLHFLRKLKKKYSFLSRSSSRRTSIQQKKKASKQLVWWLFSTVLLLLLGFFLWKRKRKKAGVNLLLHAASERYLEATNLLASIGLSRFSHEAPLAFVERLKQTNAVLAELLTSITDTYLQLRYNPNVGTSYQLAQLDEEVERLKHNIQYIQLEAEKEKK